MGSRAYAHHLISIDVYGTTCPILQTADLYCAADFSGVPTVKKWAKEAAAKHGVTLGSWQYLRFDGTRWDGRVYGRPQKAEETT